MIQIPCEIYTRCVGYFRPVQQFNPGKAEEFRERKSYILPEAGHVSGRKMQREDQGNAENQCFSC